MPPHYEYVHIIIGTVWRFECVEIYKRAAAVVTAAAAEAAVHVSKVFSLCALCV